MTFLALEDFLSLAFSHTSNRNAHVFSSAIWPDWIDWHFIDTVDCPPHPWGTQESLDYTERCTPTMWRQSFPKLARVQIPNLYRFSRKIVLKDKCLCYCFPTTTCSTSTIKNALCGGFHYVVAATGIFLTLSPSEKPGFKISQNSVISLVHSVLDAKTSGWRLFYENWNQYGVRSSNTRIHARTKNYSLFIGLWPSNNHDTVIWHTGSALCPATPKSSDWDIKSCAVAPLITPTPFCMVSYWVIGIHSLREQKMPAKNSKPTSFVPTGLLRNFKI